MSVRAQVDNKFIRRYLIIALGALAFMLWGVYDGFVKGPKQLEHAQAHDKLKEEAKGGDIEKEWLQLYEKNKDKGWPRTKPHKSAEEIQGFIYFQYVIAGVGLLFGVFFLFKFFGCRGTWMESAEDGITTSWGESLKFDQITKIDKKRWAKKGIAHVHFKNEGGSEDLMIFDDFKYDRAKMSELMAMCEKGLKRDQIVGGKTEAEIAVEKAEKEKEKQEQADEEE